MPATWRSRGSAPETKYFGSCPKRSGPTRSGAHPRRGRARAARRTGGPRGATPVRREPRAIEPPSRAGHRARRRARGPPGRSRHRGHRVDQEGHRRGGRTAVRAAVRLCRAAGGDPGRRHLRADADDRRAGAHVLRPAHRDEAAGRRGSQLRAQIAELEQQKVKLGDPVFIAAQARERLGFVMPGEIPYQVQLPEPVGGPAALPAPRRGAAKRSAVVHLAVAHHRRCAARCFAAADAPAGAWLGARTGARRPTGCSARWLSRPIWTPSPASWAVSRAASWRSRTAARTASPAW